MISSCRFYKTSKGVAASKVFGEKVIFESFF